VGLGLAAYLLGRIFSISSVEFASHLPLVTGLLLILCGSATVKALWFPLIYIAFLVPLPGSFVDAITGPLKHWISSIVVELLFLTGYPVGRSGVIITVGQYQLLVADACSGLHSMISLAALGTLFVYMTGRNSMLHNVLMVISIVPIAFVANIFRVIILVLITFHLGDEAAQGFLHGLAGIVLMLLALLLFFALDAFLALLLSLRGRTL
jgi:exosortase B